MRKLFSALLLSTLLFFPDLASASKRIEIILDVSGSMGALAGGEKKMEAAKKAVANTIGSIPSSANVGLRLYGHRVPNNKKAESCQDSQLVIPFGPVNPTQFQNALNQAMPLGQTPIAYSLELAAKDFGALKDEEAVIILVSDGKETCGGDPVQVAKDLIAQGFNIKINTIGFDVDAETRAQLEGISQATGGTYMDAKDTAQLSKSLQELTQKSLVIEKEKSVYGDPIRGGDSYETAVALEPGKLFHLDHHQKKNDFDYFYIDLSGGQSLQAIVQTGEKGVDIRDGKATEKPGGPYAGIQVHNNQKQKIVGDVIIGSPNQKKLLNVPLGEGQAGRFYILVGNNYSDQHKDHPFQIEVLERFDAGSKQDAGSTEATSVNIEAGEHKGYLSPNDRTDMYKFNAKPGDTANIRVRDRDGKIKFRVTLIDSDGVKLKYFDSPNEGAAAILEDFPLEKGGDYFLDVSSYYSTVPNEDYDMVLALAGTEAAPAEEKPAEEKPPEEKPRADTPITKIQPVKAPPSTNTSDPAYGIKSIKEVSLIIQGLPFLEKAKLYLTYSGIPLVVGWLIGMIWGYVKGKKAGKKKAQSQANP
ncbi:MAG: VWA domain-containing protein [bacterium]|nr:VWA domain-containing protein [bacterium]